MFDWATGSLRSAASAEVRQHQQQNPTLRQERYPIPTRLLRLVFAVDSAATWFLAYMALVAASIFLGWLNGVYCSRIQCPFSMPHILTDTPKHAAALFGIAGYLITAQSGALAVLSIAVGLVTLIGQNGNANEDIRVYYNESLTIPLVVSSAVLLLILCLQIVWPFHKAAALLSFGSDTLAAQELLTAAHILWFCLNMAAFVRFAVVSLSFGEVGSRAAHRRRYTANQLVPEALRQQIMRARFSMFGRTLEGGGATGEPTVLSSGLTLLAHVPEVSTDLSTGKELYDVWTVPLRIALNSWVRRSKAVHSGGAQHDLVALTPAFGNTYNGRLTLVRRRGNVGLLPWERLIIRYSFRFRRI